MKKIFLYQIMLIIFLLLTACESNTNYAPVTEVSSIESLPPSGFHEVTKGETIYELAWRYGLDYRNIAVRNHLNEPYTLSAGQIIYLRNDKNNIASAPKNEFKKVINASSNQIAYPEKVQTHVLLPKPMRVKPDSNFIASQWVWPAKGKVITPFSAGHKGINIAGMAGSPVYAAAVGKVVYTGNGLRSYGNLILIKHNNLFLSAYAHTQQVFVKEGEWVRQGQKIADMGNTGTDKIMLHFEIRRGGKPINPAALLP